MRRLILALLLCFGFALGGLRADNRAVLVDADGNLVNVTNLQLSAGA